MTVYGDMVVAVNTLVDFLLLQLGARLCGYPSRPWRCLLAGLLGGAFALVSFLVIDKSFMALFTQLLCFLAMALIAYGPRRRALRPALMSFLCSAALAGTMFLLTELFSISAILFRGGVYYPIGTKVLILLAGLFYLAAAILGANILRHGKNEIYPLRLFFDDRSIALTALYDTGNTLTDPLSGKPVVIVEQARAKELLRLHTHETLPLDPIQSFTELKKRFPHGRFSLLPYRAVGIESALLVALSCKAKIGKAKPQQVLLAISPNKVSDGGGYEALIGGTLL